MAATRTESTTSRLFDAAVIGAGVVGTAIARELTRLGLSVVLVEAGRDVGAGTSKANTGILHTGFDAPVGSLEARLLRRGYALMLEHAGTMGIPIERTGALLVAWTEEQLAALPEIRAQAERNGVADVTPVTSVDIYGREPNLGPGALGGLLVPGESIVCAYTPPLAFATSAVVNGATLLLESAVRAVERTAEAHVLTCGAHSVSARWAVNAAGLRSDEVDRLFGFSRFTVRPRRGELIVFDKLARSLLRHVLLPVPTKTTKGVLVAPTVYGNVLLGPTAEDLDDKTDTATTPAGLASLWEKGRAILPRLMEEEVTATYAGLRAATESSDYQLHVEPDARYVCVGGIRSTGLSASMGIAEHVAERLAEAGVALAPLASFRDVRMSYIGQLEPRPAESPDRVGANPDYGRIVCHCERVSRGEILDALSSPIPPRTLDGLRRRTRCLQGRCQGFHCLANLVRIFAEAKTGEGVTAEKLLYLESGP